MIKKYLSLILIGCLLLTASIFGADAAKSTDCMLLRSSLYFKNTGPVANGKYTLTFKLYAKDPEDSEKDIVVWEETQTEVEFINSRFEALIGSVKPFNNVFSTNNPEKLGILINGQEAIIRLGSVMYSLHAGTADRANAIDFSKIENMPEYVLAADIDITAGDGLTFTTANRTLTLDFGTGENQIPHGNDARFLPVPSSNGTDNGKVLMVSGKTPLWTSSSTLKGEKGDDGLDVNLQKSETHIQYRKGEDGDWTDLISLEDFKGSKGDDGKTVEFRVTSDNIEYRLQDAETWSNLIAIADLRGATGNAGIDGSSLDWRGKFDAAPADPELNWVYYHTGAGKTYLWDGDSWEIMIDNLSEATVDEYVSNNGFLTEVTKLRGRIVSSSTPNANEVLKWNATSEKWEPSEDYSASLEVEAGRGVLVEGNVIHNIGDLVATDDVTITTNAEGDVTGTFSELTVEKIQGIAVSDTDPTTDQVLKYNGTSWVPATDAGSIDYTAGNGLKIASNEFALMDGDDSVSELLKWNGTSWVTMNYSEFVTKNTTSINSTNILDGTIAAADIADDAITAAKIHQNYATSGQVLKWDGSNWAAADDSVGTTYTAGNGLVLSGSSFKLDVGHPDEDQFLLWNKTTDSWVSQNYSTLVKLGSNVGGDLDGVFSNPTVRKIQGVEISDTAPEANEVLKYNGTSEKWEPAADTDTWTANSADDAGYVAAGTGNENKVWKTNASGEPGWAAIDSAAMSFTNEAAGNILFYNGTTSSWATLNIGSAGQVLNVNSGKPAWSTLTVSGISDTTISSPAADEVLAYNGSAWINKTLAEAGLEPTITKNNAFNKSFGTESGTVCQGNDIRLTDARTPVVSSQANGDIMYHNGTTWLRLAKGAANTVLKSNGTIPGYGMITGDNVTDGSLLGADIQAASISRDRLQDAPYTTERLIKWDGDSWEYLAYSSIMVSGTGAGGDLDGSYPSSITVSGLRGKEISNTETPVTGEVLMLNGSDIWIPTTAGGDVSGAYSSLQIAADAVTATEIAANAVGSSEMADNAIASAEIVNNSITVDDIGSGAVKTDEIFNNTITADDIGPDAVGNSEMADNAIGNAEMADNAIGSAEIVNNSITVDDIGSGAVKTDEIFNDTITADDIATDGVGSAEIAAGAVGTSEIANGAILLADINANSASSGQVLKYNGSAWTVAADTDTNTLAGMTDTVIETPGASNILVYSAGSWANKSISGAGILTSSNDFGGDVSGTYDNIAIGEDKVGATEIAANAVGTSEIDDGTVANADLASNSVGTNNIIIGAVTAEKIDACSATTTGQVLKWNQDTKRWAAGTDNGSPLPSGTEGQILTKGSSDWEAAGPVREMFVPFAYGSDMTQSGGLLYYDLTGLTANAYISFYLPNNYDSLDSFELVAQANGTSDRATINLIPFSTGSSNHTQSNVTLGTITTSITPEASDLQASNAYTLKIEHVNGTIKLIGIRIRYNADN